VLFACRVASAVMCVHAQCGPRSCLRQSPKQVFIDFSFASAFGHGVSVRGLRLLVQHRVGFGGGAAGVAAVQRR